MEELLEKLDKDTTTLEKYHYNVSDVSDNKVSGFRTIGILYDTDVKFVNIGEWRIQSYFDLPRK